MTAVEICPICDIAGCRHVRESKAKMTHPTDEELDALVARLKEPWNQRQSRHVAEEFDAADAITTIRAQLAEVKAEKEKLGRELNLARYGQPDFSWQVHKEALAEANARADRAEAALTAQPSPDVAALVEALTIAANRLQRLAVEFDAGTRMFFEVSEWADETRAALARVKGGG